MMDSVKEHLVELVFLLLFSLAMIMFSVVAELSARRKHELIMHCADLGMVYVDTLESWGCVEKVEE